MSSRRDETHNRKAGRDARKGKEESEIEGIERELVERQNVLTNWTPRTELGRMVKAGKFTTLDDVFNSGKKIMEPEIVDSLTVVYDHLVQVARTTRVTRAGRKYSYRADVLLGNKDGYIGIGSAKDVDRFPAINKAKRMAKLNLIRVYRGSGSWEEQATEDKHSVPFKVEGKSGSVKVVLLPAPKGTGLAVGKAIRPVMELAGIQNVWGQTKGRSTISLNFVKAAIDALEQTGKMKASKDVEKKMTKARL
ncbi:MAG: 30S ribosomal protein S5 [Candidatus Iainarchaeum sp.]|jgi:small subunit ribosomal protein S5|nr:MAG: 30S ribosomal protein S5 [archaeon ADurb.Bin336]